MATVIQSQPEFAGILKDVETYGSGRKDDDGRFICLVASFQAPDAISPRSAPDRGIDDNLPLQAAQRPQSPAMQRIDIDIPRLAIPQNRDSAV